jgi:hypothetical protein
MLNRLKRVLVESFIGAIGLGYLFASAILYFVNIFAAPIAGWVLQKTYQGIIPHTTATTGLPIEAALPQLMSFLVLSLVWYILFRWLYFAVPTREALGSESNSN